jgi:branched-chain amino acid transport system substrate-binding protein
MKKNKLLLISLIVIIVALVVLFLNLQTTGLLFLKDSETEKIGIILPLSGDLSFVGNDILEGMVFYQKQNESVQYIIEDDKGNPSESLNAFNKLYNLNNINYFLGPVTPVNTQTVYSSLTENQKQNSLFIAMSNCSPEFKDYENIVCIFSTPEHQIRESLKFPIEKGFKKPYLLVSNDATGEFLLDITKNILKENNLDIIKSEKLNLKDSEYNTKTTSIIKENPDFVFIITADPSTNFKIVRELKEKGYPGTIIVGSDVTDEQIKDFKNIIEGVYFAGIAKIEYNDYFINNYKLEKNTPEDPSMYFGLGYYFSEVLFEVLKENKNPTIVDVRKYVNNNSENLAIKGIFYNDFEIKLPMKILVVENGRLKEVD